MKERQLILLILWFSFYTCLELDLCPPKGDFLGGKHPQEPWVWLLGVWQIPVPQIAKSGQNWGRDQSL